MIKRTIFLNILLLIGVVYLFSCCNSNRTTQSYNSKNDVNHYIDTINGHVILSTVCESNCSYNISISTLELK